MADKNGVFISHIVQESAVAKVLQQYLEKAYGGDFPVFVSSDQKSIGGGREWFQRITRRLREARVVLVLVSQEGSRREWINFEAGFGVGASATVIPVAAMQFNFGPSGLPTRRLQWSLDQRYRRNFS
jgi:hypothetical protein